jgi:hypothetical protein
MMETNQHAKNSAASRTVDVHYTSYWLFRK